MSWTRTRLKHLAAIPITNGVGEPGTFDDPEWPRYVRTTDIAGPRSLRTDVFASLPPETATKALLRRDDLVMTAAGATVGKSMLYQSDETACYAGYLVRFRPGSNVDPRFISFWTESAPYWDQILSGKVISTIDNFSAGRYQNLVIDVPSLGEQMDIADYLDAETTRLDRLVAARAQMLQLVGERLDGRITSVLDRPDWPVAPLKWKTRVTVGIVIRPSELYVDEGVPCLRGFNVRPGAVNAADLAFISPASNALNAKSMLGPGDVVVVRTGKAGAAAVVPEWAVGGNCVDLLIIRRSGDIDPRFLEAVLNSAVVRRQIDEGSVGALQAHFNTEALANLHVPVPTLEEQALALNALDAARAEADAMTTDLTRQIDLLAERRQALITAAVTGQLGIPGVAP